MTKWLLAFMAIFCSIAFLCSYKPEMAPCSAVFLVGFLVLDELEKKR
jgi:hypothetical protein